VSEVIYISILAMAPPHRTSDVLIVVWARLAVPVIAYIWAVPTVRMQMRDGTAEVAWHRQ
jgi:hypothetical protein